MRPTLRLFRRFPLLRGMLVGAVMLSMGLAVLMAASPSVHHLLHGDAGESSHHCVATLLSRDHVLPLDNPALTVAPLLGCVVAIAYEARTGFSPIDFLVSPERGPPALS